MSDKQTWNVDTVVKRGNPRKNVGFEFTMTTFRKHVEEVVAVVVAEIVEIAEIPEMEVTTTIETTTKIITVVDIAAIL